MTSGLQYTPKIKDKT